MHRRDDVRKNSLRQLQSRIRLAFRFGHEKIELDREGRDLTVNMTAAWTRANGVDNESVPRLSAPAVCYRMQGAVSSRVQKFTSHTHTLSLLDVFLFVAHSSHAVVSASCARVRAFIAIATLYRPYFSCCRLSIALAELAEKTSWSLIWTKARLCSTTNLYDSRCCVSIVPAYRLYSQTTFTSFRCVDLLVSGPLNRNFSLKRFKLQ